MRQGQRGTSPPRSVNVQVAVRCRPLNERERTHGERSIITCEEDRREVLLNASSAPRKPIPTSSSASASLSGKKTFTYDHVFSAAATQEEVYNRLVEPIVDEVLEGYNCTVFAYGQTGTGKTHTMEGYRQESDTNIADRRLAENAGIIPRAVKQVFDHLRSLTDEHSVRVSHLELYNEQLTDLLSPDDFSTDSLRVYEDPQKGTFVQGLEDIVVRSEEEIFAILDKSAVKRKTAETLMNKYSSRSHSIFSITIHIKESTPDGADLLKVGKLNLVDLAGSENVGRSGAVKGRAREAGNINQSLLTLGRVITALVDRHPHVPYRDSKLTRLLQESLGGRNKTCIIATVTPGSSSVEETASTLDYAYRAKSIKNRPTVNQMIAKHVLLKEYTEEIAKLKRELDATREKNGVYLLPDEYEQLQLLTQSQSSRISNLEEKSEEYEAKMGDLRGKLEKVQGALQRDQKTLEETRKTLLSVRSDLRQTRHKLAVTTRERDENMFLMRSHETTESQLYKQGQDLQGTLSTCLADVSGLHDRVDFKSNLELENVKNLSRLKSSISQQVAVISERLTDHCANHEDVTNSSTQLLSKAKTDLSAGMELMMSQLNAMQELLMTRDDEHEKAAEEDGLKFEDSCKASTAVVRRKLAQHESEVSEKKAIVETACKAIREIFGGSESCLSEAITLFETHKAAERERMNSLLNEQRSVLSQVEEQVAGFVAQQKKISDMMMHNNKEGHEREMTALKTSKEAIIERISSVMDELIGSSKARGLAKQAEDQNLADDLTAAGCAATDALKTTHETLYGHSTEALQAFHTACDKVSSSLNDTRSAHDAALKRGRERAECIASVVQDGASGYERTQQQCAQRLAELDENVRAFQAGRKRQSEDHKAERLQSVDSFLGKVRSLQSETCEASRGILDQAAGKARRCNDATGELAAFLNGELSGGVERAVLTHSVQVDHEANKAPPKRTWRAHAPLSRTREHGELLAEWRGAADRDSDSEWRGECDVKDDTMSDGEACARAAGWGGSEGGSCRESEAEGEAEVESGGSGRRVRSGAGAGLSDGAGTETGAEDAKGDRKAAGGSGNLDAASAVLSDVSNRRMVRARSVRRRIEPVIRKAGNKSGIPGPRARGKGRVVGLQTPQ